MEKIQVYVAPSVAKSLATCKVETRNVQQKKPHYEGNRNSPKFRPRAVLSSPENDHLIGGQGMIDFRGETEIGQNKTGCPAKANYGKEALVKKIILKHNKILGLPIEKVQAPVP